MIAPTTLRIVAVIPALNEAEAIADVVTGLVEQSAVQLAGIVVVDNGSSDQTAARARSAGARVVREPRRGYGHACRAGVAAATDADVVVLLDGDGADDTMALAAILQPLVDGRADLVVGARQAGGREPGAMTVQQVVGNRVVTLMLRAVYGIHATDLGPMRAIRRDHLLSLDMKESTFGWSVEMMAKSARAGLRYLEVPVSYRCRRGGWSKVGGTVGGSLRAGYCIIRSSLRHRHWRPPGIEEPAVQGGKA